MSDEPPMQLQIPTHSDAGEHLQLINHVQQGGYEVSKEYASDHIAVYNVYPQPDREHPLDGVANYSSSKQSGRYPKEKLSKAAERMNRDGRGWFVSADD